MSENCHQDSCPFSFTDKSDQICGAGCLPDPWEIIKMRVKHGKTWACHSNTKKPCRGAQEYLKSEGLPYKVIDPKLVTLDDDGGIYSMDDLGDSQ